MNNQLIEKVIKTNNIPCCELVFSNALLDRNVAKALSKGFVEMFTASKQTSNVHNNLRHTVLNNVRKICRIEPEHHLKVNEDITDIVAECYIKNIKEISNNIESLDKQLDDFLLTRISELNVSPKIESVHNPEIIQALINLETSETEILYKNVLSWSIDSKSINVLRYLWKNQLLTENIYNDLSIKMKSEIENDLLQTIHFILSDNNIVDDHIESIFDNDNFMKLLITKCSISFSCFQICSGILNYLFILTNFNPRIQIFIELFIKNVKLCCKKTTFSILYPTHLSQIALLLDFEINKLTGIIKSKYVDKVINHLHELCEKSEDDIIMLLSHFPQWFDVYFAIKLL